MKPLFAFGLTAVWGVVGASPAAAQIGSQNALGGHYASPGMSRPLGGIAGGSAAGAGRRSHRTATQPDYPLPYAFSWYIPNYFDTYGNGATDSYPSYPPIDSSTIVPPPQPPPQAIAPPAPPVIINQYFGVPSPGQPPYQPSAQDTLPSASAQTPGDPLVPADNYYLIAYKNHSVYTALTFWVEDKTLHYVTTGNTHNQASLDLIDLDLTKTLNQSRGVPFAIAGR